MVEPQHISIVLMPLALGGDDPDLTAVRHANIDALTALGLAEHHPAIMIVKARSVPSGERPRQYGAGLHLGCHRRLSGVAGAWGSIMCRYAPSSLAD